MPSGDAMAQDVIDRLAAFDGKHVAPLRALARSDLPSRDLLPFLPGPHEVAASWVLKARAEGDGLDEATARSVFATLPKLSQPDAILHALQMVQFAPVADPDTIRPFLDVKRTLHRVWALDAFSRVAPDEAAPLITAALDDPSAAMRARARALATGQKSQ